MEQTDTSGPTKFYAAIKRLIPTFIFYAIAISAVVILEKIGPSGPCTPGLGVFCFFLLVPVVFGLMIYNIYLIVNKGKKNGVIAAFHALVLLAVFIMLNI